MRGRRRASEDLDFNGDGSASVFSGILEEGTARRLRKQWETMSRRDLEDWIRAHLVPFEGD